jgi:hypothetical protein
MLIRALAAAMPLFKVDRSHRPEPGTPEFRRLLTDALRKRLSDSGTLDVLDGTEVSRNTVIYRCLAGNRWLIAKAQMTKPPAVAVAEYQMLREMQDRLSASAVRGLRPVTVLEDLGVLVTEEEAGESLRTLIEEACRRPQDAWLAAVTGVRAAARALREFHNAYERPPRSGFSGRPEVRWYLDFSPKNVLIVSSTIGEGTPSVVLMDPPEAERWGSRCEDIGGFCYDLTRVRFLPEFLWRPSAARHIDRLKAWFIHQYFLATRVEDLVLALPEIRAAERRRASHALSWYLKPWRYRSVGKEILRLCYLGPLTAVYRKWGLPLSHRNVAELLQEGEAMVARAPDGRRLPR